MKVSVLFQYRKSLNAFVQRCTFWESLRTYVLISWRFLWLTGKGDRTGTNIAQAYKKILESLKIEQVTNKEDFMQTQHIVIMFTDGIDNNIYTWWLPLKLFKCLLFLM